MVHRQEQFYERRKKPGGIHSDLPDPSLEARSLPPGTSAQKVELIAVTRALQLRTGKILNVYTDSPYAYTILYAQGAI